MSTESDTQGLVHELAGLPRDEAVARLRAVAGELGLAERFELLHRLGIYRGAESVSGEGSSLRETRALRAALPGLLRRHDVASVLDVPCGDFHWMRQVDLGEMAYTGADIVIEVVATNQARFGDAQRRFVVLDATREPLPCVDLVLCRDLLIHLANDDVAALLANVAHSGARLLLTSHYTDCEANVDIASGDFRPIDLTRPPFALPPPLEVVDEKSAMGGGAHAGRAMALWRVADLRAASKPTV